MQLVECVGVESKIVDRLCMPCAANPGEGLPTETGTAVSARAQRGWFCEGH